MASVFEIDLCRQVTCEDHSAININANELVNKPCPFNCSTNKFKSRIVVRYHCEEWAHIRCLNLDCIYRPFSVKNPMDLNAMFALSPYPSPSDVLARDNKLQCFLQMMEEEKKIVNESHFAADRLKWMTNHHPSQNMNHFPALMNLESEENRPNFAEMGEVIAAASDQQSIYLQELTSLAAQRRDKSSDEMETDSDYEDVDRPTNKKLGRPRKGQGAPVARSSYVPNGRKRGRPKGYSPVKARKQRELLLLTQGNANSAENLSTAEEIAPDEVEEIRLGPNAPPNQNVQYYCGKPTKPKRRHGHFSLKLAARTLLGSSSGGDQRKARIMFIKALLLAGRVPEKKITKVPSKEKLKKKAGSQAAGKVDPKPASEDPSPTKGSANPGVSDVLMSSVQVTIEEVVRNFDQDLISGETAEISIPEKEKPKKKKCGSPTKPKKEAAKLHRAVSEKIDETAAEETSAKIVADEPELLSSHLEDQNLASPEKKRGRPTKAKKMTAKLDVAVADNIDITNVTNAAAEVEFAPNSADGPSKVSSDFTLYPVNKKKASLRKKKGPSPKKSSAKQDKAVADKIDSTNMAEAAAHEVELAPNLADEHSKVSSDLTLNPENKKKASPRKKKASPRKKKGPSPKKSSAKQDKAVADKIDSTNMAEAAAHEVELAPNLADEHSKVSSDLTLLNPENKKKASPRKKKSSSPRKKKGPSPKKSSAKQDMAVADKIESTIAEETSAKIVADDSEMNPSEMSAHPGDQNLASPEKENKEKKDSSPTKAMMTAAAKLDMTAAEKIESTISEVVSAENVAAEDTSQSETSSEVAFHAENKSRASPSKNELASSPVKPKRPVPKLDWSALDQMDKSKAAEELSAPISVVDDPPKVSNPENDISPSPGKKQLLIPMKPTAKEVVGVSDEKEGTNGAAGDDSADGPLETTSQIASQEENVEKPASPMKRKRDHNEITAPVPRKRSKRARSEYTKKKRPKKQTRGPVDQKEELAAVSEVVVEPTRKQLVLQALELEEVVHCSPFSTGVPNSPKGIMKGSDMDVGPDAAKGLAKKVTFRSEMNSIRYIEM